MASELIAWPELIAWLDRAAFVVAGAPVTWAEVVGDVAGAACVILVARRNIWNWPVGLINNLFWGWLFFRAKLYADSSLQVIFFALGCYGWWRWMRLGPTGEALRVRRARRSEWIGIALLVAVGTAAAATLLALATDSPAPVADASVLTLSLAATWAQAEKVIESWWLWIAVDLISVPLYLSRALYPTAALYVVFGIICVFGLRAWSAAEQGRVA